MDKITSRDNPKLKLARKVRDGHEKKLIFVEGRRLAEEALRSGIRITEIFLSEDFHKEISDFANLKFNQVSNKIFDSITDTKNSQGIILLAERPKANKADFENRLTQKQARLPLVIFLSQINNPSNLGAVLRSAEAADVRGVIISKNSADVFSPKSIRASMGAGFRLNLWTNAGLEEVLSWARDKHLTTTAADIRAQKSYAEIDWRKPRLLIFGSEAHGLRKKELADIDESFVIPMENQVESLNLAVSCGIVLFEAKKAHQP
jgi:TrmH family RNA methyltransferase